MLDINPKMPPRLDEIEDDLQARRSRAAQVGGSAKSKASTSPLPSSAKTRTDETADPHRAHPPRHTRCPACGSAMSYATRLPKGTVFPSAYRQVVRTFSQARAVRP